MKVCITFHNDIFTPWPATSIIHPVETLLEAGHEVVVFSWDKGRGIKLNEATLPVRREQINVPVTGNRSFYRFTEKLSVRIQEEKPDLIFAFDLEVLKGSSEAADSLGIPLLFFAREDWPAMVRQNGGMSSVARSMFFSRMEKQVCRHNVAHAYAVNDERGQKYVDWGIPYTTIFTTRGVSELPVPDEKHERLSIALAGSMHEINALPAILQAIRDIDCDLYLIGGNSESMEDVNRMVAQSGMEDRVKITGRLESRGFYDQLSRCHIGLTLPHKTDMNKYYGITVKTWDYMSMGMAIVSSNFPAQKAVVEGNSVGVTVDPESVEEIRNGILAVKGRLEDIAPRARKIFEEKYCWEKQREKLVASHWIFRGSDPDQ